MLLRDPRDNRRIKFAQFARWAIAVGQVRTAFATQWHDAGAVTVHAQDAARASARSTGAPVTTFAGTAAEAAYEIAVAFAFRAEFACHASSPFGCNSDSAFSQHFSQR